ncbi:MAG: nicotinate-nucleotide adenylyltransferase [Actinobacteria bacterium]|nr:MAG: nicotinate-nucleotide adenylyltransferase [Actinomycetota bacterium]
MGGTFNPIHYGHLVTAEEALAQFGLDEVVFMVAGQPAHKVDVIAEPEDRYLMTVIATASNHCFSVSRLEIDRGGISYTVDTLRELSLEMPEAELFFITGADAVWEILTWKEAEEAMTLTTFIAATRPGYDLSRFERLHARGKDNLRLHTMEIPALAISSTDIRARVRTGRPIRYLLPEGVASHIAKRRLYGGAKRH